MPHISDLAGSPIPFTLLAGPSDGIALTAVTAVETLDHLERAPAGALAVVTAQPWARTAGYQLDIGVRTAAERHLAALVLVGGVETLPITAARLAERAGLAVLAVPAGWDVADVVVQLDHVIRGGAADALGRAQHALRIVADHPGPVERLLADVSGALRRTITQDREGEDGEGEPVWVNGRRHGAVSGPPDDAVRLVLPALAAAVGRIRGAELDRAIAPGQTRSDVLASLLSAERAQAGQLADRARALGFAVDELHTVLWLVVEGGDDAAGLAERRRLFETLTLHAHDLGRAWNLARVAEDVALVATGRTGLGEAAARRAVAALREACADHPGLRVRFGVGTAQRGVDGLRQSSAEARAAAALAARGGADLRIFDATGINRVLAGIAGSPLSRKVVDDLLAPLDALGPPRAAEAIATLAAYLDARGSLKGAAAVLNLHPNAVNYRIRRITEQLGLPDLADPDTSFSLHLACRVRLRH
ncbi:PucR family transcriptional regulator [Actinocorallia aurea]